jgi:hypothetical protein
MSENSVIPFMSKEEFDSMNQTLQALADGNSKVTKITKREFAKQKVMDAFHDAFDLIGGVPRLADWAHQNPTEFYKLYGKMLPAGASIDVNHDGQIIFKHVLPPSKLDGDQDDGPNGQSQGTD